MVRPIETKRDHQQALKLLASADELIAKVEDSDFFKERATIERAYPIFDQSEIAVGPILGHGGFGVVCEIEDFVLNDQTRVSTTDDDDNKLLDSEQDAVVAAATAIATQNENNPHDDDEAVHEHYEVAMARKIMASMVRRNGTDARYAIKCLRPDRTELDRVRGMIDAVIEVKFLSRVNHPNIGTFESERNTL
jgi:serine/threonine protein kinase